MWRSRGGVQGSLSARCQRHRVAVSASHSLASASASHSQGLTSPWAFFPNLLAGNSAGSQKAVSTVQEAGVKPCPRLSPSGPPCRTRRPGVFLQVAAAGALTHCRTSVKKKLKRNHLSIWPRRRQKACERRRGQTPAAWFPSQEPTTVSVRFTSVSRVAVYMHGVLSGHTDGPGCLNWINVFMQQSTMLWIVSTPNHHMQDRVPSSARCTQHAPTVQRRDEPNKSQRFCPFPPRILYSFGVTISTSGHLPFSKMFTHMTRNYTPCLGFRVLNWMFKHGFVDHNRHGVPSLHMSLPRSIYMFCSARPGVVLIVHAC